MRTTLTLTIDEDLAQFIQNQPGLMDASALINHLLHADRKRRGIDIHRQVKTQSEDEISRMEEFLMDENTHAAE